MQQEPRAAQTVRKGLLKGSLFFVKLQKADTWQADTTVR